MKKIKELKKDFKTIIKSLKKYIKNYNLEQTIEVQENDIQELKRQLDFYKEQCAKKNDKIIKLEREKEKNGEKEK